MTYRVNIGLSIDSNITNQSESYENQTLSTDNSIFNYYVKALLVISYTLVFSCCFFGNILVISVVFAHKRMKTVTNFFLTNLAFADFCVGIFCVYQNLSLYLTNSWAFGDFMCKMYHFIQSLSYTASIAILTVISVERYVAIVHPMSKKQVITMRNLRMVIICVWVTSALYCSPRLIMYGVVEVIAPSGDELLSLCVFQRSLYDSRIYDITTFVVCFVIPLLIISVLYTFVCLQLWKNPPTGECTMKGTAYPIIVKLEKDTCRIKTVTYNSVYSTQRGRKKITRLLVSVVLAFAICNLPFHARKIWQYSSSSYDGKSTASMAITIVTTLVMYMNSGINPFLYAFFSDNFRQSMTDLLLCRHRRK